MTDSDIGPQRQLYYTRELLSVGQSGVLIKAASPSLVYFSQLGKAAPHDYVPIAHGY